jgi:hypothetical protein
VSPDFSHAAFTMDDFTRVVVTDKQIGARLDELAVKIRADYAGKDCCWWVCLRVR